MTLFQALILGAVQGAAEFMPVSSSGHLVLVPWLLGWGNPGLTFNVVAHLGTTVAVLGVFWRDWLAILNGGLRMVRDRNPHEPYGRLLLLLVLATLPVVMLGPPFQALFERLFAAPIPASCALLGTAVLLAAGEWLSRLALDVNDLGWPQSMVIGLAQAVALIPGISRSGTTMTAGRLVGLSREATARFSFLLATPAVIGAALYDLSKEANSGHLIAQWPALLVGFAAAAVIGYVCIRWLLRYVQKHSLLIFSAYCVVFGVACLAIALAG
jgi:undecaprenyl-diphosphatase